MRIAKKVENYYVEVKMKLCGQTRWGEYLPIDSADSVEECEAFIEDFIKQNKEQEDLTLWKFRIMKRIEKHYAIKTVAGK